MVDFSPNLGGGKTNQSFVYDSKEQSSNDQSSIMQQPNKSSLPPPKPPGQQPGWGDLEVVVSLHDEEESVKTASTYSKKKKTNV